MHLDRVELQVDTSRLLQRLGASAAESHPDPDGDAEEVRPSLLVLTEPAVLKRVGQELRLVIPGESVGPALDASLAGLIARAQQLRERIFGDEGLSTDDVARADGLSRSYVTRLLRLSFLAPDIVARLLSGEHPPEITATRLMADTRLPLDWAEQRRMLALT